MGVGTSRVLYGLTSVIREIRCFNDTLLRTLICAKFSAASTFPFPPRFTQTVLRTYTQDVLAGDHEEHAILLHNFILHLIMIKERNVGANCRPLNRTCQRTEART